MHKAKQDATGGEDGAATPTAPAPKLELQEGQFIPHPDFSYTGSMRPVYPLGPKREVPAHIPRPDYADHRACLPSPARWHALARGREGNGFSRLTPFPSPFAAEGESACEQEENMNEAMQMRKPSRLYAAKIHTPEEIAGLREACKASPPAHPSRAALSSQS